jgi:hypothetical protein
MYVTNFQFASVLNQHKKSLRGVQKKGKKGPFLNLDMAFIVLRQCILGTTLVDWRAYYYLSQIILELVRKFKSKKYEFFLSSIYLFSLNTITRHLEGLVVVQHSNSKFPTTLFKTQRAPKKKKRLKKGPKKGKIRSIFNFAYPKNDEFKNDSKLDSKGLKPVGLVR